MILTDDEMQQIRRSIEEQAGLDDELRRRAGDLIHMGKFDEAVRSAFVLLEERLRKAVNKEGMTGTNLANHAFNPQNGPLAQHLAHSQSEREGLRELYSGAFKLFRNPTAHGVVGYDATEGKAIIGLVNLMLKLLERVEHLPPPGLFPENVEAALMQVEEKIGPGAAGRIRIFLGECIRTGIQPNDTSEQWIGFRQFGLLQLDKWDEPKPHEFAVFYLRPRESEPDFIFSVHEYYQFVVDFNVDRLVDELVQLGFRLHGRNQNPRISLRTKNDQEFLDALLDVVRWVSEELKESLKAT